MPDPAYKSLESPDETIDFPGATAHLVEIGDLTIAELITRPGWRWSTNNRPIVGGDWCQARHVRVIVSGTLGVRMLDGTEFELGMVRQRFGVRRGIKGSRFVPASTWARSSSSEQMSVASVSTRRRGSWPLQAPTRSSSLT